MFKTALFDCTINEKCCSVDGGWGTHPTPGNLLPLLKGHLDSREMDTFYGFRDLGLTSIQKTP